MKKFRSAAASLLAAGSLPFAAGDAIGQDGKSQTIFRVGSQPSVQGPAENFTGRVRVDPMFPANETARYSGGAVTFEPGARSAWHTHPAGQHLIVTAGIGLTQDTNGSVAEIRAGDVVWCPPGVKHWHGASPTISMTHIALSGTVDGKNVQWMEKVTEDEYKAAAERSRK